MSLRASAICGLLAPVTFITGWLLGGIAQPSAYSMFDHDISDLGAMTAASPWLYNQLGSNVTGLLILGLVIGLWKTVGTRLSARVGVLALGVVGTGQFLDGIFRLDCREIDAGCAAADVSWHGNAHGIETAITVLGTLVTVLALARAFRKSDPWRRLWLPTLITAVLFVFSLVGPVTYPGDGFGARVATTVWFVWLALVSYRLLKIAHEERTGLRLRPAEG
jgi:hypothetical protein